MNFFSQNFKFSRFLGRGSMLIDEMRSFKELLKYKIWGGKSYNYKTEELHDVVKLHYHFQKTFQCVLNRVAGIL